MEDNKKFDFTNRVVVITGASSGLDSQMAKGFAAQHANLVLLARRVERLEDLAKDLRKLGVKVLPLKCDVTNTENVNECAKTVEKEFDKVAVLVNCAGASKNAGVLNMTHKDSQESLFKELTDYKLIELLRRMKILHFTNENLYTPCSSDDEIIKACEIFNVPILKEGLSSGQIQKIIKMKS